MTHSLVPLVAMALAYLISAARSAPHVAEPAEAPPMPVRAASAWLACQFSIGHVLSTVEVAPLPLAQRLGTGETAAAAVIAVLCGSSVTGGAMRVARIEVRQSVGRRSGC
jgi:hypothetical protein